MLIQSMLILSSFSVYFPYQKQIYIPPGGSLRLQGFVSVRTQKRGRETGREKEETI